MPPTGTRTVTPELAPPIGVGTPTAGTGTPVTPPPRPLIPVTGADLSEAPRQTQVLVSRIHQLQSGLNFLGIGFLLIGITLMVRKKEEED